jgi:hypothetical protein
MTDTSVVCANCGQELAHPYDHMTDDQLDRHFASVLAAHRNLHESLADAMSRSEALEAAGRELLARPCSCSLRDSGCGYVARFRAALGGIGEAK